MLLCCPCSIALDPLYPSRCSWETFGYATSTTMTQASDELTPLQLSGQLNSLPCSMSFRQEESTSIIRLIEQVSQAYPLSSTHPSVCSSQRAKPGAHMSFLVELPAVRCQHWLFSCLLSFVQEAQQRYSSCLALLVQGVGDGLGMVPFGNRT